MIPATKVFAKDFIVDAHIGVHDHEKGRTQPLRVSCIVTLKQSTACHSDNINDTYSYADIVDSIQGLASGPHIELVEHFAEKIAARCLENDQVIDALVTVEKTAFFTQGVVGTEIYRTKSTA